MSMQEIVEPQRCLAVVRLPATHKRALCALHVAQEDASGDSIRILVATVEGHLYVYTADGLRTDSGHRTATLVSETLWDF